MAKNLLDSR